MRGILMIVLAGVAVPDRPAPDVDAAKPIQEQLVGEWIVVKRVMSGREADPRARDVFAFTRETMQYLGNEAMAPAMRYVLDPGKNPVTIDLLGANGRNFDMKGIIKLEGDLLTLCVRQDETRPTEFASTVQTVLIQMKRHKK
jgi:uncharacterized protein (TIGR03067 family)